MSPQKKLKLKCEICPVGAKLTCVKCNNVHYCSEQHQKKHHRDEHGAQCRPIKIVKINRLEDKLIVTRNIEQSEIVFREKPLYIGPGFPTFYLNDAVAPMAICLGCYREANLAIRCPRCKWPMCSVGCEKEQWHKNFECEIIKNHEIEYIFNDKMIYYYISLLRVLLLKEKMPESWGKLVGKFEYQAKNSKSKEISDKAACLGMRLKKSLRLEHMHLDYSKLKGIVQTLEIYAFTSEYSENISATCLFESCMKISLDCTPNTYAILGRRQKQLQIDIYAVLPILKGEDLTRIIDSSVAMLGTYERRKYMIHHYEYECKCKRCCDPTELGSYVSAFKCSKKNCEGYMLPRAPLSLDESSVWKCNTCPKPKNICFAELSNNLRIKMEAMVAKVNNESHSIENPFAFEEIARMETVLKYSQIEVHRNHQSLWDIKDVLMGDMVSSLQNLDECQRTQAFLARCLLELGRDVLMLSNIIIPGLTPGRAKLLYYMAKACRYLMLHANEPQIPEVFHAVDRMEKVALDILTKCCQNYFYSGTWMKEIVDDLEKSTQLALYDGISNLFIEEDEYCQ